MKNVFVVFALVASVLFFGSCEQEALFGPKEGPNETPTETPTDGGTETVEPVGLSSQIITEDGYNNINEGENIFVIFYPEDITEIKEVTLMVEDGAGNVGAMRTLPSQRVLRWGQPYTEVDFMLNGVAKGLKVWFEVVKANGQVFETEPTLVEVEDPEMQGAELTIENTREQEDLLVGDDVVLTVDVQPSLQAEIRAVYFYVTKDTGEKKDFAATEFPFVIDGNNEPFLANVNNNLSVVATVIKGFDRKYLTKEAIVNLN